MGPPEGATPRTQRLGGVQGAAGGGVEEPRDLGPSGAECSTGVTAGDYLAQGLRPPSDLPCQNSHKCIEGGAALVPSAKRTAFALQVNVQAFVERHGIERVGFLTLTFAEHILDARVAQKRMHSLVSNVLKPRYQEAIRVIERQKSGRIHYHLLVALDDDIRTGVDFEAMFPEKGSGVTADYRSAPAALRREWVFWRATARRYGFGRTELAPVRSSSQAIGRYVGKYIAKHLEHREERDKRLRLVSYLGTRVASTRFAWASGGAAQWRQKLAAFVAMLFESGAIGSPTMEAMRLRFGPRWARYWRDNIMTFPTSNL